MDAWIAIAVILIVAFITPGPNNFLVLNAAARRGLLAALPVVAAVNLGGVLLLALAWSGAGAAFEAVPQLAGLLAIAGGAYLAGLGAAMALQAMRGAGEAPPRRPALLPGTWPGIVAFQFVNPKAWILTLTVSAAVRPDGGWSFTGLAAMYVVLSGSCLATWAVAGSLVGRFLADRRSRRRFDWVMGGLLIVSAGFLVAT